VPHATSRRARRERMKDGFICTPEC